MIEQKKRILMVLPSLRAGGAERVISFLAKHLSRDLFDVQLIIVEGADQIAYDISNVNVTFFNKRRVLHGVLPLLKILKAQKPDIVMSSIGHLNVALGCISIFFPKIKFVGREASVLSEFGKFAKKKRGLSLGPFYRFGYKKMDIVVCQSKDMYDDFKKIYGLQDKQMIQIANPAPENMKLSQKSNGMDKIIKFITIGRLSPEKGHLRLLECLSELVFPFKYTIIGSGVMEKDIKDRAKELRILENIEFVPFTDKINDALVQHDLFIQGSYVEGFPNAVVESCVSGVPVIAYNAPGGTKEIIENGTNGFLVESSEEFVQKLTEFKKVDWDAITIRESVYKKYRAPIILSLIHISEPTRPY